MSLILMEFRRKADVQLQNDRFELFDRFLNFENRIIELSNSFEKNIIAGSDIDNSELKGLLNQVREELTYLRTSSGSITTSIIREKSDKYVDLLASFYTQVEVKNDLFSESFNIRIERIKNQLLDSIAFISQRRAYQDTSIRTASIEGRDLDTKLAMADQRKISLSDTKFNDSIRIARLLDKIDSLYVSIKRDEVQIENKESQIALKRQSLATAFIRVYFLFKKNESSPVEKIYLLPFGISKEHYDYIIEQRPDFFAHVQIIYPNTEEAISLYLSISDESGNSISKTPLRLAQRNIETLIDSTKIKINTDYYLSVLLNDYDIMGYGPALLSIKKREIRKRRKKQQ